MLNLLEFDVQMRFYVALNLWLIRHTDLTRPWCHVAETGLAQGQIQLAGTLCWQHIPSLYSRIEKGSMYR